MIPTSRNITRILSVSRILRGLDRREEDGHRETRRARAPGSVNAWDALGPAPRAELLHVLMLPDLDRAEGIGEFWGYPESRAFAELLIDCEEDKVPPSGDCRHAAGGGEAVAARAGA